jgi:hypothetical protein
LIKARFKAAIQSEEKLTVLEREEQAEEINIQKEKGKGSAVKPTASKKGY